MQAGIGISFGRVLRCSVYLLAGLGMLACSGRPDGRIRAIAQAAPAPGGGAYVVAEKIAALPLPGIPVNLLIHGRALYVFMNMEGMSVYDIANPAAPRLTARFDHERLAPGKREHYFFDGAIDGGELLVADRMRNLILIFDVSRPLDPRFREAIALNDTAPMRPLPMGERLVLPLGGKGLVRIQRHPVPGQVAQPLLANWDFVKQAVDHPPHWLLAADNYVGGLRVIDLSDPARPFNVATFQTGNFCDGLIDFGGFAVLNNRVDGLLTLDLKDPAKPFLLSVFRTGRGDAVSCLARWGRRGVLAGQRNGYVDALDVTRPDRPLWLGRFATGRPVQSLAADGDLMVAGIHWTGYTETDRGAERLQIWRLERRGASGAAGGR